MFKIFSALGGINALLSVMLGAFGAHTLKDRLSPEMLNIFQTAVQYHFYHSLGLLAVGLIALHLPDSNWLHWSGWLMLGGIILFSGSLYLLSFTGFSWIGAITPIGGTAFIVAWITLVIGILKG